MDTKNDGLLKGISFQIGHRSEISRVYTSMNPTKFHWPKTQPAEWEDHPEIFPAFEDPGREQLIQGTRTGGGPCPTVPMVFSYI